jgi:hypothetical protein
VLFPRPTRNVDGSRPVNGEAYRGGLRRWLERCDIRGEDGRPVRVTRTSSATPSGRCSKGAELHQIQHSVICVRTVQ